MLLRLMSLASRTLGASEHKLSMLVRVSAPFTLNPEQHRQDHILDTSSCTISHNAAKTLFAEAQNHCLFILASNFRSNL